MIKLRMWFWDILSLYLYRRGCKRNKQRGLNVYAHNRYMAWGDDINDRWIALSRRVQARKTN